MAESSADPRARPRAAPPSGDGGVGGAHARNGGAGSATKPTPPPKREAKRKAEAARTKATAGSGGRGSKRRLASEDEDSDDANDDDDDGEEEEVEEEEGSDDGRRPRNANARGRRPVSDSGEDSAKAARTSALAEAGGDPTITFFSLPQLAEHVRGLARRRAEDREQRAAEAKKRARRSFNSLTEDELLRMAMEQSMKEM